SVRSRAIRRHRWAKLVHYATRPHERNLTMGWLKDFTRSPFDYGASARRARHRRYEDREYQQLMANRPDALGMNYAEMTPEQRKAVRNFYMKPGQNAWNERATIDFYQLNNRINPPGSESPYGLWGALGTRASKETIEEQLNQ
ncbi:MAG: hypothetical protein ACPGPS_17610, partial [Rubripirellula sp.]